VAAVKYERCHFYSVSTHLFSRASAEIHVEFGGVSAAERVGRITFYSWD